MARYLISYFYNLGLDVITYEKQGEGRIFVTIKGKLTEKKIIEIEKEIKQIIKKDIGICPEKLGVKNFQKIEK